MTTEELIQKIDALGLHMSMERTPVVTYINVKSTLGNNICRVSSIDTSWFSVDFAPSGNVIMDEPTNVALSRAISKYLATPLDKRNPEKKYRLVWQEYEYGGGPWVLGYEINSRNWDINDEDWLKGHDYQTRFTDADLKKIADGDQDMLDRLNALKKEVKDDAC